MDLNPPLVGRDKELELLFVQLGNALSGRGGLVLISGEAGIGKTRILTRLCDAAVQTGFIRIGGGCVPGIPIPFLPFHEAFASFSGGPFENSSSADLFEPKDPASILFKSLELLTNESTKTPLLICLEDLHWADSSTIQLLYFLSRKVQGLRVLMVGTYRSEDLVPSIEGETHPLLASIRLMNREGTLIEVPLGRIDNKEMTKAIEGMLGAPADPELEKRILERGDGNPLFVVETLRMLVSEKRLLKKSGSWTIIDNAEISMPKTIQEVVLRRMEMISKDQRRILECASVIGETFDPELIVDSIRVDRMHLLDELDILCKSFQLVNSSEEGYKFTHMTIREVTYNSISKPRRMELHRRIGCSIEKSLPDDSTLATLSWHFNQAQDKEKALMYSIMAGENFMKESSYHEAISEYKIALDIVPDDASHLTQRLEALEGLGDAYREQCISSRSIKYYDMFLGLNTVPKDRVRVLCKNAMNWNPANYGKGDTTRALEILDLAESYDDLGQEDIANIEFQRATVLLYIDQIEKASKSMKRALDYFASTGDEKKVMELMKFDCFIKLRKLQYDDALKQATYFLERAYASKNRGFQIEAEWAMGHVHHQIDQPAQALLHLAKCEHMATESGDLDALLISYETESEVEEELGNFLSARVYANKALRYAIILDDAVALSLCYTRLGRCSLYCGDIESTEACLANGWKYAQQLTGLVREWFEGLWLWSKAQLEVAKGNHDKGFGYFDSGMIKLDGAGSRLWSWAAMCHIDYAKALIDKGLLSQAKEHLDEAYRLSTVIGRFSIRKKVHEIIITNDLQKVQNNIIK